MSIVGYRWCTFLQLGRCLSRRALCLSTSPSFPQPTKPPIWMRTFPISRWNADDAVYRSRSCSTCPQHNARRHFPRLCFTVSSQRAAISNKTTCLKKERSRWQTPTGQRLKSHQTPIASVQPLCSLPLHPRQPLYAANYQRTISTSCFGFFFAPFAFQSSRPAPRTYSLSSLLPSLLPLPTARNSRLFFKTRVVSINQETTLSSLALNSRVRNDSIESRDLTQRSELFVRQGKKNFQRRHTLES